MISRTYLTVKDFILEFYMNIIIYHIRISYTRSLCYIIIYLDDRLYDYWSRKITEVSSRALFSPYPLSILDVNRYL